MDRPSQNFYGLPGLIEMPTAESLHDGDVALTTSRNGKTFRNTFTFQITPRLSGSFRYSLLYNYGNGVKPGGTLYDRSFDLRYRFVDEGDWNPAVAVGLRDFTGTGVYSSEYVVATKHVGSKFALTGGIGWGRLASRGGFENPLGLISNRFKTRPGGVSAGNVLSGRFFRGDAAFFGGIAYRPTERLILKLEYSSDAQVKETNVMGAPYNSPFNLSATYRLKNGVDLTAAYLYGGSLSFMLNYTFNPKHPKYPGGTEQAGPPVIPRDYAAAASWGRLPQTAPEEALSASAGKALAAEGLRLMSFSRDGDTVVLHIFNPRFDAVPEALGRAARGLTAVMPADIDRFVLVPVTETGMSMSAVTIRRGDLERLDHSLDQSWQSYGLARIDDAANRPVRWGDALPGNFPKLNYKFSGYLDPSYFDPDSPIRANLGVQAKATYALAPGFSISGSVRKKLAGTLQNYSRANDSVLPHVRTDSSLYDKHSHADIPYLTGDYFFRPGANLYGHVSAGLLETQYAGVATEVLWKPVASSWAFGVTMNYARKRDYDMLFGLRDYSTVTGHATAYYNFGGGYLGQISVGRYLAGDWGTTVSLDREFANGIRFGAFFTLTNVSSTDFGEGSFDKGIRFTIPLSWLSGQPSQNGFGQTIRPITRDGGATLNLRNRLYDIVRGNQDPDLQADWGKFWR
ncbi:YjbH domain-containing protein [Acidimangrovimonas sediminis]|uniref:YjbH domain-containing protein n=1 Tax=Acidimangrovimonas sediminis TaxID=2056283 RepID=UPI001304A96A|nr:YjbH domain-containing protein [Acidimangrovimonas sediminis]